MSLFIVATPIGNPKDISLRALEILKECDLVIGEDRKPTALFLKSVELKKEIDLLNEHSDQRDLDYLVGECKDKKVALISDCGTPSFCDPGFQLVRECRKKNIPVTPLPGASSLMTLLSIVSEKVEEFQFLGFLPKKEDQREAKLKKFLKSSLATIFMDTPYRLKNVMETLVKLAPDKKILIGLNMTSEEESYIEGSVKEVARKLNQDKAEFVILIYPS